MSDTQNHKSGDRKRAWRDEGAQEGGRDGDRGSKQMKPGALAIKLLVPNSLVGAIIGKGGEEMKKLKEESNCFIRLSQNDKYFPNTTERPCYIEGFPDDICKAVTTIQEKLVNDSPRRGPSIDDARKKQCTIIVGSNAAGKTIGKGGENAKRLNSEFSVWVKVMGRDDSIPGLEERTVTINGEIENAVKAVKDILDNSLELKNGGTDKNLDYDSFMGGAGGQAVAGNQGYQGNQSYNQSGNFGNQQQGYNQAPRTAAPAMGGGQGYNNMGQQPPAPNSMGNYNNAPPVQQYNSQQYQGNAQQYPANNSNVPVQQYPGAPAAQPAGGYGAGAPAAGYTQGAAGYTQGYGQTPAGGAYNQPAPPSGAPGGYSQAQGQAYNPAPQGYQSAPAQGGYPQGASQSAGYQGGNQQGGYQATPQGGNYQAPAGRGGYQGAGAGGRGSFRGGAGRGGRGRGGN